ncbi:hypothetical protein PV328_006076 [Microctonus aethiopoides]|uniref:Uncharacterized protein n=1 Tax=Microctonus aethiopoides TaxID=144406 RepID=A0AA39FNC6_9HYME|nr:hypothetical protein PV328_006076 [Microctonus aethiopoides]
MKQLATAQGTKLSVKQFSLISEAAERGFALNACQPRHARNQKMQNSPYYCSHFQTEEESHIPGNLFLDCSVIIERSGGNMINCDVTFSRRHAQYLKIIATTDNRQQQP